MFSKEQEEVYRKLKDSPELGFQTSTLGDEQHSLSS
jgi:hypothetical protein